MPSYLSTFLQLLGFSFGMYLLARYRLWKASRASIPMEWNPRTQRYEADLRLKRWEKRAKIGILSWGAFCILAAFMWGVMSGMESLPH